VKSRLRGEARLGRYEVDPASRTTGVDFLIGNLAAPIC